MGPFYALTSTAKNWGDVWYSRDGKEWTKLRSNVVWKEHHEHSAYVLHDKIWVAGGHAQPLSSEVWSLEVPREGFEVRPVRRTRGAPLDSVGCRMLNNSLSRAIREVRDPPLSRRTPRFMDAEIPMTRSISCLRAIAAAAMVMAAARYGQSGRQGEPARSAARLHLTVVRADSGRPTPARVYLFKDGKPFRLSPVDVLLPLRVDLHYRERLWRRPPEQPNPDGRPARTLEVTNDGESHFVLLDGEGRYELPAGRYRLEAYRGLLWAPVSREFELRAGEDAEVTLNLRPLEGDTAQGWISGDDHIHLTRAAEDDPTFLRWLEAEDLSVGNFLQLQRQADAAVQYGFGRAAEARGPGYSVRSGEEARSEFYGHVNLLGPERLVRPLSVGTMYANTPTAYPFPGRLFAEGRSLGAAVGYAHFDGSMKHSTLPLDLALGGVDFIEVFQFGELKADRWYELLNAGFRVTGIAGSDFPANLSRFKPWPRAVPLLGPERTLVKVDTTNAGAPVVPPTTPGSRESAGARWSSPTGRSSTSWSRAGAPGRSST